LEKNPADTISIVHELAILANKREHIMQNPDVLVHNKSLVAHKRPAERKFIEQPVSSNTMNQIPQFVNSPSAPPNTPVGGPVTASPGPCRGSNGMQTSILGTPQNSDAGSPIVAPAVANTVNANRIASPTQGSPSPSSPANNQSTPLQQAQSSESPSLTPVVIPQQMQPVGRGSPVMVTGSPTMVAAPMFKTPISQVVPAQSTMYGPLYQYINNLYTDRLRSLQNRVIVVPGSTTATMPPYSTTVQQPLMMQPNQIVMMQPVLTPQQQQQMQIQHQMSMQIQMQQQQQQQPQLPTHIQPQLQMQLHNHSQSQTHSPPPPQTLDGDQCVVEGMLSGGSCVVPDEISGETLSTETTIPPPQTDRTLEGEQQMVAPIVMDGNEVAAEIDSQQQQQHQDQDQDQDQDGNLNNQCEGVGGDVSEKAE